MNNSLSVGASAACSSRTTLETRVASLREDYSELEGAVSKIEAGLDNLYTRPLRVNCPEAEKPKGEIAVVEPPTSQLGREIDALGIGMRRLTERLRDLHSAIDL